MHLVVYFYCVDNNENEQTTTTSLYSTVNKKKSTRNIKAGDSKTSAARASTAARR